MRLLGRNAAVAGCCCCCTVHGTNEPSGCRAGTQDMDRDQGWVCSGSTWNPSHALGDAETPSMNSELFSQINYKITRCWAVTEPRDCRRKGKNNNKKNSTTTPTTVAKFKYLLQSGLQQLRACPHLFAPCRRISLHASAGCSWSSNHQLNPADKVGKSGYNYILMSPKHHYHMKDTVTNGFTLWKHQQSEPWPVKMMGVCCKVGEEHPWNSGGVGAVKHFPH